MSSTVRYGSNTRRGRSSPRLATIGVRALEASASSYGEVVANLPAKPETAHMSEMNREEVKARLEASEARIATSFEAMRADASALRAEMQAQGDRAQASADRFYAEARALLADSRAALTEIKLVGEQNRTSVMAIGYKVLAWLFGALLAIGGVSIGVYNALKPTATASAQGAPLSPPPSAPNKTP